MITKEYINMCEMAEEVQKEWEQSIGDVFIYKHDIKTGCYYYITEDRKYRHAIHLPTLEQLFEMVINYKNRGYDIGGILLGIKIFTDENNLGGLHIKELIIRWVMHELYHKSWNGEKWEAIA